MALSAIALAFALIIVGVWANAQGIEAETVKHEFEQLRSKIETLENTILERTLELKTKDESIKQLEQFANEKSATILSLQSEIKFIQNKGAVDAEKLVGDPHARTAELEKEVEKLSQELEVLNRKRNAMEARAGHAEKMVEELNLKLENLQKTSNDQKHKIEKIMRALQVEKEELLRSQIEATTKSIELTEAHGAWLPPWFETYLIQCRVIAASLWQEHAKPHFDLLLHKVSDGSAQVQKWLEPQFAAAKTKWVPAIKEKWEIVATNAEPYVQKISAKIVEVYEASMTAIMPHVFEVKELIDPHFQEAKRLLKPYIDQAATIAKPYVEKAQVILKPYNKHAVDAYGEFKKSAKIYHLQVQAGIEAHLNKHELTKSLAVKGLVWLMASSLFVMPVFMLYQFLLKIFCKKSRKVHRHSHASHTHRRPKRRHASK